MELRGGMEFELGRVPVVPAVPESVLCDRLVFSSAGGAGWRVSVGDRLSRGQRLTGDGSVWSPVDGRVVEEGVGWRGVEASADGEGRVPASVSVDPPMGEGPGTWATACERWGGWPGAGLGMGPGLSLATQLRVLAEEESGRGGSRRVIGVGLERFPPFAWRSGLVAAFADELAMGLEFLGELIGAERVTLVVHRESLKAVRDAAARYGVRVETEPAVYPRADPTMLAYRHGRRTPLRAGANPAAYGLMIVSAWSAIRLARWINRGRVDLVRPVFLAHDAHPEQDRVVWALPGTPAGALDDALRTVDADGSPRPGRVLRGDVMTGRAFPPGVEPHVSDDEPVLCRLPHAGAGRGAGGRDAEACVSCGWCIDACPTHLDPVRLADVVARSGDAGRVNGTGGVAADHLSWCIGCGLCSAVCPSSIPLAATLTAARDAAEASAAGIAQVEAGEAPAPTIGGG